MTDLSRPDTTNSGWRNWNKLVSLAASDPADRRATKLLADALAALLSECTPIHREVAASQMATSGAVGRVRTWRLPPGLASDELARRKWAALVLLDCIDSIADTHIRYSAQERESWRVRARKYTQGAEFAAVQLNLPQR